ncbi:MAG: M23 family metallopeptidase [Verrucomicrobia bacterium]|nr:M23 family metallopeptidase [Cytophagales bacterium]
MKKLVIVSLFFFYQSHFAQTPDFACPVEPGKPNFLTGNFAELRPDHFHAGIDIRTNQKNPMPVRAAADGFVSEIRVMASGYGNVLFLRHAYGYTTVYGHLDVFAKPIADFVRKKQYENQSFTIILKPDSLQFPVKKGDIIGNAGNTGSSFGQHLHFEIRDSKNTLLDPLHFNFKEFADNLPPVFQRIALRTMEMDSRVNGEFGFSEFYPRKISDEKWVLSNPVAVFGTLGLEALVHDVSEGSFGRNGVSCVEVKLDGKEIYSHQLDSYPYELSRFSNVFGDYEIERTKGTRYQKCFVADGNTLQIYQTDVHKGKIRITDNQLHTVEISLWDDYHNGSHLKFFLQGKPEKQNSKPIITHLKSPYFRYWITENTLLCSIQNVAQNQESMFYVKDQNITRVPDFLRKNEAVYLWDMRKGLPDSVKINDKNFRFFFKKMIVSHITESYIQDSLKVDFSPVSLFDTLYLEVQKRHDTIKIGNPTVPLQTDFTASLIPTKNSDTSRTRMYLLAEKKFFPVKSEWQGGRLQFTSRYFGTFVPRTDTIPPVAKLRGKPNPQLIACTITDELSGIASYWASINGVWLLMNYDAKNAKVWSERLDKTKPLSGKFRLEVKDKVGNLTVLEADL